jgi:hypothetical protein
MLPELVKKTISDSGLPITSCSLKPMDFGNNIVYDKQPGVVTMFEQILKALETSQGKYVFFCEHDVLYHPSHFKFTPTRQDTFYYNINSYKCHLKSKTCITYKNIRSVSGICVNRRHAVGHYRKRLRYIYDRGYDKLAGRNPRWARIMGYEPGKSVTAGGFTYERIEYWKSKYPNVDIRHKLTITPLQLKLKHFKHKPKDFVSVTIDEVPGWNLRKMFHI